MCRNPRFLFFARLGLVRNACDGWETGATVANPASTIEKAFAMSTVLALRILPNVDVVPIDQPLAPALEGGNWPRRMQTLNPRPEVIYLPV